MNKSHSIPEELIKIKAHEIWKKHKQRKGIDRTPESDWIKARKYLEKHQGEVFLWKFEKALNKLLELIIKGIKLDFIRKLKIERVRNSVLRILAKVKGDSTQQVVDLILFLGYFSSCLYAGGIAYESKYNSIFHLEVKSSTGFLALAVSFITNVIIYNIEIFLFSILYIAFFIVLYYFCRYIFRPWFGYFTLTFLLYFTFLLCSFTGYSQALLDATNDRIITTTATPTIKIYGKDFGNKYTSGEYHLLSENKNVLFIFIPPGVPSSIVIIDAVSKSKIEHYEVIIK